MTVLAGDLHPCRKPDCGRRVAAGSAYCCAPCATAAQGHYETDRHSPGCDQRSAERDWVPGWHHDLEEARWELRGLHPGEVTALVTDLTIRRSDGAFIRRWLSRRGLPLPPPLRGGGRGR